MSSRVEASKLRWSDTISEAVSTITQRPARTLLTALGTILGVGAFVATNGLAETARAQVSSRFDALKATEVIIQDAAPDGTNPFPADVASRLKRLNGVKAAGLYFTVPDNGDMQPRTTLDRLANTRATVPVVAAQPGALLAALPTLRVGRLYDEFFESESVRVAVIGRAAATKLGITRIDNQPAVFIGDTGYTIIGIIDDVERNPELLTSIAIPVSTATRDLAVEGATYQVLIDTEPGSANLAGRQAPIALRPDQPQRLQALVPPDPRRLRGQISEDVTSLFLALSALSLLIGAVAIANATLLNVIERRGEIGLRRALGAQRAHIRRQITVEASMVGAVAGVVGASFGVIAIVLVSISRQWTATIDTSTVLAAPAIGLLTGAVAGIIPSVRASRTPPAETLRG
jgi:putative ABC transport system permease protein